MRLFILFLSVFFAVISVAEDSCGRKVLIENKEVFIDFSNGPKGEGLRYYLQKDGQALKYLDQYQENAQLGFGKVVLTGIGGGLLLTSLFLKRGSTKKILLYSGLGLISLNIIILVATMSTNEANLFKAIEEYNQRQLPQIYLIPSKNDKDRPDFNILIKKEWSF